MKTPLPLYACLCAFELPMQAILRFQPALKRKPIAVLGGQPPLETVCSLNDHAEQLGIAKGMTKAEAETFPSAVVFSRSQAQETSARDALFECAGRFSPRIEDCSKDGCLIAVLDIAGSSGLFGEPQALGQKLIESANSIGIRTSVVVAGNLPTAVCLANSMGLSSRVLIVSTGEERLALSRLAITELDFSPQHVETFRSWGITTFGELANLPEEELVVRLGADGNKLWHLARGEAGHLFLPSDFALCLEEKTELDSPVEIFNSLLFVIASMLDRLIALAKMNLLALASITLELALEEGAEHVRTVRPALPSNDRQLWLKLIDLDLQEHPPRAAVLCVGMKAQPGHTGKVQLGLFCPQVPEPMKLDVTMARIRAIVGEDRVGLAQLLDVHHPQGFRIEPFTVPAVSKSEKTAVRPYMALRQVRPPEKIVVDLRERCPHRFTFCNLQYQVERAYGPWLSSGDWWNPELWSIEQWDVVARAQTATGICQGESLLCCCLTHDRGSDLWLLEGLYD
jgi:protein ImuB